MAQELLAVTGIVLLGGLIKGLNGFGYAVVSTPLLALIMPVQEAVALMILPLMAANTELGFQADRDELERCLENFRGLYVSLLVGVTLSMLVIAWLPVRPVEIGVALLMLLFVASRLEFFNPLFSKLSDICFKSWEPVIGFFSGLIYGVSNIAVTVVAYLKSRNITQEKFVATLAAIVLGLSIYRTALAYSVGLFTGPDRLILSLLMCVPAVVSVEIGRKIAEKVPERPVEISSLVLVLVIAVRLLFF